MKQYFRSIGLTLLLSLGFGSLSQAASFDCNKATTETEIAICNDPQLSKLDEVLSELYRLKISLNFSSEQLSRLADDEKIPAFLSTDTQVEQVGWIKNDQTKCFGNTSCLTHAYTRRIQDFFISDDGNQKGKGWRILDKLAPFNSDYSISVWTLDNNIYGDGCLAINNFETVYYLVAIHHKQSEKLIAVNSYIVPPRWGSCVVYDIDLSSNEESQLLLTLNMWSAVGGWGVSDYTYKIGIQNNVAYVNALRSNVYQRNELVFETTEVDFVKSKLQIEIDNSSDRDQVRFGKTLKPEQGLSIEQQFERISPLPFTDFTPSVKYETVRKIVQQLGLEE